MGGGEEYAYEALNFADGTRTAQQIDTELSAEYGPIPTELVVEYLRGRSGKSAWFSSASASRQTMGSLEIRRRRLRRTATACGEWAELPNLDSG